MAVRKGGGPQILKRQYDGSPQFSPWGLTRPGAIHANQPPVKPARRRPVTRYGQDDRATQGNHANPRGDQKQDDDAERDDEVLANV